MEGGISRLGWPTGSKDQASAESALAELTPSAFFKPLKDMKKKKGLKIGLWGEPEAGKSYCSQTFPPPVHIIDTDIGSQIVADENFPDKDIRIFEVKEIDPDSPAEKAKPLESLQKLEQAILSLRTINTGTIVVDVVTDWWNWLGTWVEVKATRYTKSGQMMRTEWQMANKRYKQFVFRLLLKPINIVFIAQAKRVFSSRGEEMDIQKPKWQYQTKHWLDVIFHMRKRYLPNATKPSYSALMTKCRWKRAYDAEIPDLTYDLIVSKMRELGVKNLPI